MRGSYFFSAIFLAGSFLSPSCLQGQPGPDYSLSIRKTATPIRLDGILDEPVWKEAGVATDFFLNYPFDTTFATNRTEARVCFDDQFLYVGAVVFQKKETYLFASLKRDYELGESDEFHVNIDPFSDKLNGFHFAVSPSNVQREGAIDNGNTVNIDWDNKWFSQVTNEPDRWTVEMAIPFQTLRYKNREGANTWRINFTRVDLRQNEASTWVPVPRQFEIIALAFSGELRWQEAPPKPGFNASLIPYVTGRLERDYEFQLPLEPGANAGLDAKIAITPSLNLDLTIHPDFSQVDVDEQITDLSRFELFYPERRQFFLENEDLFSKFGFPNSRPFFSRRIGLAEGEIEKTTTGGDTIQVFRSLNVPILAGARLSGKPNPNWRVGLLNMTTAGVDDLDLGPANYSVGAVHRKVFDRSFIGAVFVNKENFSKNADGGYSLDHNGYNRVAGLEYNLYSKDNKWEAEVFYHRSFSAGSNKDAQSAAVFLGHFTRKWQFYWSNQYVGSNYRADMGFVPRTGFLDVGPGATYNWFPKKPEVAKKIIRYWVGVENDLVWNRPDTQMAGTGFQLVDRWHELNCGIEFPGQSDLSARLFSQYTYLSDPYDPTESGGVELPKGSDYTYTSGEIEYYSDQRKKFYLNAELGGGQYFNGTIFRGEGSLYLRLQPYGVIAAAINYNDIRLPKPYNSARFWLIGPRAELAFSRSLFFSAFLQYNTQADNVNINSRLQWRFRPVSDLFLVYTDNYFSENFFSEGKEKNRALVLKLTYWLNL